ncbi:probable peregrin at C-terminar half [Coccomyxa sp. Obi]|nr:probable peregrin at C-terminar half [Coccomyxa sp. Obi]
MGDQRNLRQILEASRRTVEEASDRLQLLPARSERRQCKLPQTFTEASQYVQAKEDEKRKREAKKDKQKQRGSVPATEVVPGLIPGPPDSSPFWLVTEGYFRDVTKEDLAEMLPSFANPLEDPIFLIPPMGRPYSLSDEDEPVMRSSAGHPRNSARPSHQQPLLKDRVSELKAQAAAESPMPRANEEVPNSDPQAIDDTQRKSRRLVARAVKDTDSKRPEDELALPGTNDNGADFLLERCSESELAFLTSQVLALQSLPEAVLEKECGWEEARWREWLTGAVADSSNEHADAWTLPEEARSKLYSWLAAQALKMVQHQFSGTNGNHSPAVTTEDTEPLLEGPLPESTDLAPDQDEEMGAADDTGNTSRNAADKQAGQSALAATGIPTEAAISDAPTEAAVSASSLTGISAERAATFQTWREWQAALSEQPPPLPLHAAEDEYMHPYTALILEQGPTQYVLRPEPDTRHVASMSGIATPSAVTPSASAEDGSAFTGHPAGADAVADSAATPRLGAGFHPTPSQLGAVSTADHSPETPALQPLLVKAESSAGLNGLVGPDEEAAERVASGSFAGTSTPVGDVAGSRGPLARQRSQVNYSIMAGNSTGRKAEQAKAPPRKSKGSERHEPRHKGQTAAAVQSAVASGGQEGSLEDQWQLLGTAADVLTTAPDDEILAEMLALQSELTQQVAVNRSRLGVVLERLLPDIERQKEATEQQERDIEFAKAYFSKLRAAKRGAKREKREAAARDALAEAQANLQTSPRPTAGRSRASAEPGGTPGRGELVDIVACRKEDEEALCAVCSGGLSVAPNYIVFCERCDVAVHQHCYGITDIPPGEWLCWPCRQHEEEQLRAGLTQHQIRPPRWEAVGPKRQLDGGSLAADCALCPVRCGAFRRTVDTGDWVHQVCALWVPDLKVRPGAGAEAVEGVPSLKTERWGVPCTLCGSSKGVVLRCNAGHCTLPFHALCARNAGYYLAMRPGPGKNQTTYRAYCAQHSESQRRKDASNSSLEPAEGAAAARKADVKRREKEEAAAAAALRSLAAKEAQQATLLTARLELESLRVLLERIGRRERIKMQVVRATQELYSARAANPAAGLATAAATDAALPLRARAMLRQQQQPGPPSASATPRDASTPEPFDTALPSGPAETGSEQPQQEPLASAAEEARSAALAGEAPIMVDDTPEPEGAPAESSAPEPSGGNATVGPAADADAEEKAEQAPAAPAAESSGAQSSGQSEAGEKQEGGQPEEEAEEAPEQAPPETPSPSKRPPVPKRKRDAEPASAPASRSKAKRGKAGAGMEAAAEAEDGPGMRSRLRGSSSSGQLDRQCLMTSSEAAASNSKLPKGLKYVPMQTLRKSSRPTSGAPRQ